MLDGEVTDVVEASSLNLENQHIEIYSSSWGPDDDGMTVDGPGPLARRTFEEGISEVRKSHIDVHYGHLYDRSENSFWGLNPKYDSCGVIGRILRGTPILRTQKSLNVKRGV